MISRLRGTLVARLDDLAEVATEGGVVYEVHLPLTVAARLPAIGSAVELLTVHIVREDLLALFGFLDRGERELFRRLIGASKVGPRLALAMLSTYSAPRLVEALRKRDIAALVQVPGVGRRTAEHLALELSDRLDDLELAPSESGEDASSDATAAVQMLIALGIPFAEADRRVRALLAEGASSDPDGLVRRALAER
jgi:Holliday junction DNA helicase RuvA